MADIPYTKSLRDDIRFDTELCGQPFTFLSTWGIFSRVKLMTARICC
ncbi:hypothetical protein [Thiothrix subterranea]|nr:hypothetical protein [Thiothrix subterranea]